MDKTKKQVSIRISTPLLRWCAKEAKITSNSINGLVLKLLKAERGLVEIKGCTGLDAKVCPGCGAIFCNHAGVECCPDCGYQDLILVEVKKWH